MSNDRSAVNRRQLMRGIGGAAAASALAPWLLGASEPFNVGGVLALGEPEDVGMSSARVEDIFARIQRRVNDGLFPGATALIARYGVIVGQRAFGSKVPGGSEPTAVDTLFDLESMTKVVATATSVMILAHQGRLS